MGWTIACTRALDRKDDDRVKECVGHYSLLVDFLNEARAQNIISLKMVSILRQQKN